MLTSITGAELEACISELPRARSIKVSLCRKIAHWVDGLGGSRSKQLCLWHRGHAGPAMRRVVHHIDREFPDRRRRRHTTRHFNGPQGEPSAHSRSREPVSALTSASQSHGPAACFLP